MRLSRRHLLFGSAASLWAQKVKFSTDVNVVTILATVRDKDGRVAKNLNREDFGLLEDGAPQTIAYFSRESDLPLTIGLLVDTSRSQIDVLEPERAASYKFLDQVLREDKDAAFVAAFDTKVRLMQGFTSSRQKLAAALARLEIPPKVATLLFEAVRKTSENQMRPSHGRKAFVLLSDGCSFADKATIATAIEFAQRADTIIYSILFATDRHFRNQAREARRQQNKLRGRAAMGRLARETGGAFFEVFADNPIEKIYADIEDALRNQYSIGFTPQSSAKTGAYHRIKLTTAAGLIVQAREGYYSK